ncbi:PorT family protein [Parapedobacter lycopersici]|uniref:PorT family protein n=1 Tax=Parapedobacter lycopersici TaxID=1864939 RepID=UPI00214D272D|nr:PorT family protein [Parapedobacter lycopersici]
MLRRITPFLLLVILLTLSGRTSAQDYYSSTYQYKPISLGITFSPNMGWMRYGDSDQYQGAAKLGYAYGLLADFAFSENYYFASGLLINTLNTKSTGPAADVAGATIDREYRIQYAEIPIALKLKSTQRYFRSYYGLFGFTAGFKLNAKEKQQGADTRTSLGKEADLLRLALQIGGGVEWQLDHNLVMMTGLTFNNGFTQAIRAGEPRNSYAAFNFAIFF